MRGLYEKGECEMSQSPFCEGREFGLFSIVKGNRTSISIVIKNQSSRSELNENCEIRETIKSLGFGGLVVLSLRRKLDSLEFGAQSLEFRVQGALFRIWGAGCRV